MLRQHFLIAAILFLVMSFLQIQQSDSSIYRLITETLQNNVAGEPITHERTEWNFDPEISKKRRSLFYESHGFRAEKFIERIGVGRDGLEEDRRIKQQHRDFGKINGAQNINYS